MPFVLDENSKSLLSFTVSFDTDAQKGVKHLGEIRVADNGNRDEQTKKVISVAESRFIPGSGGDVLKALENFPGVVMNDGVVGSGLYVRGSDSADNLYLFGDMRIGNPYHSLGFFNNVFPAASVDGVVFYQGGFPSSVGGAQGAAVEILPRTIYLDQKFHAEVNASFAAANLFVTIPFGDKLRLSLSGTRSYYEPLIGLVKQLNLIPTIKNIDVTPFMWDYFGELTWTPIKGQEISLKAVGKDDFIKIKSLISNRIGDSNVSTLEESIDDYWHGQVLTYHIDTPKVVQHFAFGGLQSLSSDETTGLFIFTNKATLWYASEDLTIKPSSVFKINFGTEVKYQSESSILNEPKPGASTNFDLTYNPNANTLAGLQDFLADQKRVAYNPYRYVVSPYAEIGLVLDALSFNVGSRFNYNTGNFSWEVEPRADVRLDLTHEWNIYARAGRYTELPHFILPDRLGQLVYQDPKLLISPATYQYSLGSSWSLAPFHFQLEAFDKEFKNQVLENPTYDTAFYTNQASDPHFVSTGTGRAYGIDLLIRKPMANGWFGWISYSYGYSERSGYVATNTDYVLRDANNNGEDYKKIAQQNLPFSQDVTHSFRALLSWEIDQHWRLGSRFSIRSGKPYTRKQIIFIDGSGTNQDKSVPDGVVDKGELHFVDSKSPMSDRYPIDYELDLRIDFSFKIGKAVDMSLYFDFWNVQMLWHQNTVAYAYLTQVLDEIGRTEFRFLKNGERTEVPAIGKQDIAFDIPLPILGMTLKF